MLKDAYDGRWTDDPERFNADPALTFIGQVRASREGVNLSTADDLIFFGVDFAALSMIQGRDRASYLGRTRENRVHWIIAADGIEEKVYQTVSKKEDFTVNHYRNCKLEHA
jgi:SNF2 family DNA or RNA helicase